MPPCASHRVRACGPADPARRWIGLTATPYRQDQLDDLIALQLNPPERPRISRGEVLEPVTNQVTTTPGNGRRSSTPSDTDILPACGNRTQCDAVRRNRQAWHARGQGFESPKLHKAFPSPRSRPKCLIKCLRARGLTWVFACVHVCGDAVAHGTTRTLDSRLCRPGSRPGPTS
jgi:hypothetical protein